MIIISIIKVVALLALCINSSISDIKKGVVKNYTILIAIGAGIVLNAIEWIFISSEYILVQIINILIVFILSILLYAFHIWAAGDCKLMFAIAVLIPYDLYLTIENQWFSLIFVLAFSFAFSYLFLIGDSIYSGIKRKHVISTKKIFSSSILFLKKYIACISYIRLFLIYLRNSDVFFYFLISVCPLL